MKYNRCLRCELNYIFGGETHCDICKKELAGGYSISDDNLPEEDLCPYCERNHLAYGEEMCSVCAAKRSKKQLF